MLVKTYMIAFDMIRSTQDQVVLDMIQRQSIQSATQDHQERGVFISESTQITGVKKKDPQSITGALHEICQDLPSGSDVTTKRHQSQAELEKRNPQGQRKAKLSICPLCHQSGHRGITLIHSKRGHSAAQENGNT